MELLRSLELVGYPNPHATGGVAAVGREERQPTDHGTGIKRSSVNRSPIWPLSPLAQQ
jgi:hypothetical protein